MNLVENFENFEDPESLKSLKQVYDSGELTDRNVNVLISKYFNNLKACKILISNKKYTIGNLPYYLYKYTYDGNLEGIKLLNERCRKLKNLYFSMKLAIKLGYIDIVEYLKHFLNPDRLGKSLLLACEYGNNYIIKLFLSFDVYHPQALVICVKMVNIECCKIIIGFSTPETFTTTIFERTPLIQAIESNSEEIFELLLPFCDVNYVTPNGKNAFSASIDIYKTNKYFYERLITFKNLDFNVASGKRSNPLITAISNNNLRIFDDIINSGIDVNFGSSEYTNPLSKLVVRSVLLGRVEGRRKFLNSYDSCCIKMLLKMLNVSNININIIFHDGIILKDFVKNILYAELEKSLNYHQIIHFEKIFKVVKKLRFEDFDDHFGKLFEEITNDKFKSDVIKIISLLKN